MKQRHSDLVQELTLKMSAELKGREALGAAREAMLQLESFDVMAGKEYRESDWSAAAEASSGRSLSIRFPFHSP